MHEIQSSTYVLITWPGVLCLQCCTNEMLVNQMFNLNSHSPGRARTRRERLCFPSWCLLEQDWEQEDQRPQCPNTQSPGQGISHGCWTGGGSPEHWSLGTGSPIMQRGKQTFLLNASNQEKMSRFPLILHLTITFHSFKLNNIQIRCFIAFWLLYSFSKTMIGHHYGTF